MMKNAFAITLVVLIVVLATSAHTEDRLLTFQKKIGVSAGDGWTGWMGFVAFSQDGTEVASDGPTTPNDRAGGLTLWSFPEGRLIKHIPFRPWAMADNWQYYTSEHGVIDIPSGTPMTPLRKINGGWTASGFSADGQYVAFGTAVSDKRSRAKRIRVERTADGTLVSELGRRAVFSLAFHPDTTMLASGHWDNVTLWNELTGERIALLQGFGRYIEGVRFSRDGALLAAGTDGGALQIWDVPTRTRRHAVDLGWGKVSALAFSPDGALVAAGVYGPGTVFVVDVASGTIRDRARVSEHGCGSVAFSPDGRYLITPSTGGLITWPYDRGGTIRVFEVGPRHGTPK